MRSKILKLLKDKRPAYISGEEMARMFAVSRTSIWKNIRVLQADGYQIEGSPRRGYRLAGIPDLLLPAEIAGELQTEIIASSPEKIIHYRQLDSTNNALKGWLKKERLKEQCYLPKSKPKAGEGSGVPGLLLSAKASAFPSY